MNLPEIGKLYHGVEGVRLGSGILMLVNIEYADRVTRQMPKPIKIATNPVQWAPGYFLEPTPNWMSADRYVFTKPDIDPSVLVRYTFLNLNTQAKEAIAMEGGPSFGYFFSEIDREEDL